MELSLKVAVFCISGLFCFQCISCDEPPEVSNTLKWRCICTGGPLGSLNYSPASNCSSSCDCIPDETEAPNGGGWNCSCASDGTPQATSSIHGPGCFTSCNCTSGPPDMSTSTKKHVSHKNVLVILLLCVMITTIAFFASIACYFYRKDKFPVQLPVFSSEKESSWNSATNLISHRSGSFPASPVKIGSHLSPISAFIHRILHMFGSERGTLLGAIAQFSYVELEQATDKFSNANMIGRGGSSNVYHGQLKDGRVVAIKKLQMLGGPEADYAFMSEIELISRLNHCHVVPLLGYCSESHGRQSERLLVFEYMSNGNLRDCLDAKTQEKGAMDWATRVGIALGAAKGLEYLHEAAAPRILHRDIKSTNILLDDKYRAKITDLGMAKRMMTDDLSSCSSSPARMLGTFGYFAPEYAIVGKASPKSDVFSFGVVILELISGRQPIHKSSTKGDESLVIWATARLRDSKLVTTELPDPLLKGKFPEEEMQIMAHLARECLQWDPDSRPTMSEVVQILLAIAPDKSRWRNFPTSFFMSSSSSLSIKSITEIERLDCSIARPELSQIASERVWARCSLPSSVDHQTASETVHARSSLPLSVDRNLCEDQQKNSEAVLSSRYMDKLMLLTSSVQSWRSSDDETLDLTEPRFEAFVQPSIHSL